MNNILNKKKNKTTKKGFSLVEIMLYVAILSIFLLSMTAFINSVISAKAKNRIILEVERQGEYISSVIYESIVNSQSLNNPISGTTSSLSLNTFDSNLNPTIFRIVDNRIAIKEGVSDDVYLNSENIIAENLVVTENSFVNSPENITLSFTLKTDTENSGTEYNYSQDFYINASRKF